MSAERRVYALTAPSVEPCTIDEVKLHARLPSGSTEDTWITAAITAARSSAELYTGCAFIQRTFRQTSDFFSGPTNGDWWDGERQVPITALSDREIELLPAPLVSVQSIKSYDDSDAATTVDPTTYIVDASSNILRGRVALRRGQVWPIVLRPINGLEIDFTAGMATTAAGLPPDIVLAIKMMVAYMYENRGECSCDGATSIISPCGAGMLLNMYKQVRF